MWRKQDERNEEVEGMKNKNDAWDKRKQTPPKKREKQLIIKAIKINVENIRKNVKYMGEIEETEKKNSTKINSKGNEKWMT